MMKLMLCCFLLASSHAMHAQAPPDTGVFRRSVDELRNSIGSWAVTTEFLNDDGSVAKTVTGTYEFSWIIRDRVVSGKSVIPELDQASGILFYVSEQKRKIEMVSVGADGALWIMTGPLGGDQRMTQEYQTGDGGTGRLRFTRYNVSEDAFESRMEYTDDGGKTWKPGNHQKFTRAGHASE